MILFLRCFADGLGFEKHDLDFGLIWKYLFVFTVGNLHSLFCSSKYLFIISSSLFSVYLLCRGTKASY